MQKLLLALLLCSGSLFAQVNVKDSLVQGVLINFQAGAHVKGGDIATIFGPGGTVGVDIYYKTKSNWLIGAGGRFHYGNSILIENQIFTPFLAENGNIIAIHGSPSNVLTTERGLDFSLELGYITPWLGHNPNSGVGFILGAGYITNWINFNNSAGDVYPLTEPYYKGYDRMQDGFQLNEFVGYMHFGNRRTINFMLGLEFQQGFTKSLRKYNYDTRSYDLNSKLDLYYGIRMSWFIPLYDKNAQKFYYY